jgi:hypothetical protein
LAVFGKVRSHCYHCVGSLTAYTVPQPRLSDAALEVALHIDAAMVHAANAKHDAAVRGLSEESG